MPDAESLVLFIDSTEPLYRMKRSVEEVLLKKVARGVYDGHRARAAFAPVTEAGAKRYVREMAHEWQPGAQRSWHLEFPKSVRDEADKDLVDSFWTKVQVDSSMKEELARLKSKQRPLSKTVKAEASGQWKRTIPLAELKRLPTLAVGQADDLKIDTGTARVWLSRMKVADGMPYNNQVTVEQKTPGGKWVTTRVYKAPGGPDAGDRGARHERGENPRVSRETKRRMDRVLGRGRS